MESDKSNLEGGRACGAVRYRLASGPMFVHCCHCRDCQRQTGSAFVINALRPTGSRCSRASSSPSRCPPTAAGCIRFSVAPVVRPRCGANTAESRLSVSSASARSTTQRRLRRTCISTCARSCRGSHCRREFPASRPITTRESFGLSLLKTRNACDIRALDRSTEASVGN